MASRHEEDFLGPYSQGAYFGEGEDDELHQVQVEPIKADERQPEAPCLHPPQAYLAADLVQK